MSTLARETVTRIPQLPQAQYDLTTQLQELRIAAVRLGLYDADQWLADIIDARSRT